MTVLSYSGTWGSVKARVIAARKHLEVLDPVVELVSVYVMDLLTGIKLSSKVLFHYVSVFKHIVVPPSASWNLDNDVSGRVYESSSLPELVLLPGRLSLSVPAHLGPSLFGHLLTFGRGIRPTTARKAVASLVRPDRHLLDTKLTGYLRDGKLLDIVEAHEVLSNDYRGWHRTTKDIYRYTSPVISKLQLWPL